jgi:pilus assembly protein CpaB
MLRPLILIIALGSGGAAAWIAAQETAPQPAVVESAPTATETTAVLVAARGVPRGQRMNPEDFRWQTWPAGDVPSEFIERGAQPDALDEFTGYFANRAISAGEPIASWSLAAQQSGFLAGSLMPGMRAVAINVNAQSTAGGFILPHDRVDVLHTMKAAREPGSSEVRSRTILRGVRVLAIDQTTEDTESGTVLGKTATLELTDPQVEAVTAAEATGTLSLSLRPFNENPDQASMMDMEPTKTIRVRRGTSVEDAVIN